MVETIKMMGVVIIVLGALVAWLIVVTIQQTKRLNYLSSVVAELNVLVLANPHTDEKLVEHFNLRNLRKMANDTEVKVSSDSNGWKPHHY